MTQKPQKLYYLFFRDPLFETWRRANVEPKMYRNLMSEMRNLLTSGYTVKLVNADEY